MSINASHDNLTKMFNDGVTEVDEVAVKKIAEVLGAYGFKGVMKVNIEITAQGSSSILDCETRSWSSSTPFRKS